MANPKEKTPMCLVNELARFNKIQPEYKLLCEQGPAHSKVLALTDSTRVGFLPLSSVRRSCGFYLLQIFSVRLTLADQHWEAEGTSIKKAQHSAAASALAETTLPKPIVRTPRITAKNPGGLVLLTLPIVPERSLVCDFVFLLLIFGLVLFSSRWLDADYGVECTLYEAW